MGAKRHSNAKRRTTVALPAGALREAKQVARARNVNLSTIVSEALVKELRLLGAAERRKAAWESYRQSFRNLSEEDIMALDGIILSPKGR